jgi:protein gp37
VSPGCANCYAETLSRRYKQTLKRWTPANAAENVILKPHKLREPLSGGKVWRGLGEAAAAAGKTEGKLVFVNSMSDLFHELVPEEFIALVFGVMAQAQQHTFQVLTKRPERMRDMLSHWDWRPPLCAWPLPNVWLGTSIENRKYVERADRLRETPAAVRFISAEPLLGPLLPDAEYMTDAEHETYPVGDAPVFAWRPWADGKEARGLSLELIDWLIVGGESGPGHRPMSLDWARALRDECRDECWQEADGSTALFVKQLGGARPGDRMEDLPEDLRIRDFPGAA